MNTYSNPSSSQTTIPGRGRLGSMLRAGIAAALLVGAMSQALAVDVTFDRGNQGTWIGNYGSCAYVIPSAKVSPNVETPILPGTNFCDSRSCDGNVPPIGTAGRINFVGGATSNFQDCTGQTSPAGVSDVFNYSVRLCSQPANWPSPFAQGFIWTGPGPADSMIRPAA